MAREYGDHWSREPKQFYQSFSGILMFNLACLNVFNRFICKGRLLWNLKFSWATNLSELLLLLVAAPWALCPLGSSSSLWTLLSCLLYARCHLSLLPALVLIWFWWPSSMAQVTSMYLKPHSQPFQDENKFVAILYCIIPMYALHHYL